MSTTLLDVEAVRRRFSALQRPMAFFDGPGGTQCPDEVINAIADYLREDNANIGAPYDTSVRTVELVERSRATAGRFLNCHPDEVAFGPSMTSLNFLLTRALGRTLREGDEIVCTKLDHDANVAPWLELEHDLGVAVRLTEVTEDLDVDLDHLESLLSERTRVVAFPIASNAVGTKPDVARIVELAHGAGALAWADAVHYGPHGPIDVTGWDVDVLICSPYKYFGPHLGLAFGKRALLESWRPYKVRPASNEPVGGRFEHGTQQHELLAGFVAAVEYVDSIGWDAIVAHETELGQRFLDGLPEPVRLYGLRTMAGRVPTFTFNLPGRTPEEVGIELAARDIAVWHGDYYALEIMKRLGLEGSGAVRAGFVHYNTAEEVDRLLAALAELLVSAVGILRELIRFDTTNPPGNEAVCIEYLRRLLEEAGCETEIYAKEEARPNLVSRIAGGDAPPLLLQGHVDVVTTVGQRWTHPPFEAVLADGAVWGRGALDMKAGVAMLVNAFLRAKREEVRPPGDLVLVVLSDEEAGGNLGAKFLVEEHPELFEGMRYALGEFGGFTLWAGGRRFYPIQVAEKQICWLKATVRGPGGHGALVHRGGTVARLGKLLTDLDRKRMPVHVLPIVQELVETIAATLPRHQATVMRSVLKPRLTDSALRLMGEKGVLFEPMLRNTANATIVRGGTKINVVPSEIEVELDGRALPGFSPEQLMDELQGVVGSDIELELVRHDPGPAEPDLGLFETLAEVIRELDPEGVPVPLLQIGVTDGRFFSRAGIQTYGFLPMRLPEEFAFTRLIHAADERIPVDALEFGAEAVWRAIQRFH